HHEQAEHGRPQQRVQVVAIGVQHVAEGLERRHRRGRNREQERVEREPMSPYPVRRRCRNHEPNGYRPTSHGTGVCVRAAVPSLPSGTREKGARMPDVPVTWLGHGSFRIDSPGGKRVYLDPWLGNPKCPDAEKEPERIDVIALTHGHNDHVGETVELSKQFSPEIVANVELKSWLGEQGAPVGEIPGPNKGGTVEAVGVKFTLVNAFHSSGAADLTYLGEAAGIVMEL